MNCISCKEEISEKFKYALSQNVCPYCGKSILSESEIFRRSIIKILNNNGVKEDSQINGIINDIESFLKESPEEIIEEKNKILEEKIEINKGIEKIINKKTPKRINFKSQSNVSLTNEVPNESLDLSSLEEIDDATPEEKDEIKKMIENKEIIFSSFVPEK